MKTCMPALTVTDAPIAAPNMVQGDRTIAAPCCVGRARERQLAGKRRHLFLVMRLSEAIVRGRVFLAPTPGRFVDDAGTSGCVMGMAAVGVDAPVVLDAASSLKNVVASEVIRMRWPWLLRFHRYQLLCGCKIPNRRFGLTGWRYRALDIIIHTFDEHVADSQAGIQQLIDWVRRVEPRDPLHETFERIAVHHRISAAEPCRPPEALVRQNDEVLV